MLLPIAKPRDCLQTIEKLNTEEVDEVEEVFPETTSRGFQEFHVPPAAPVTCICAPVTPHSVMHDPTTAPNYRASTFYIDPQIQIPPYKKKRSP